MRLVYLYVLALVLSAASCFAQRTVSVSTNGVVVYPVNFFSTNDIARKTAADATNAAQDLVIGSKASTNVTDALAATNVLQDAALAGLRATNALQDASIGSKVGTNNAVFLKTITNLLASGSSVSVTNLGSGNWRITVTASTGTAASVQANLDLHTDPTNTTAHTVTNVAGLLSLLEGKASTNGAYYPLTGNPSTFLTEATSLGVTNVTGGILTIANRMIGLTATAISNAVAGVYELVGHLHSYTAITNAPWSLQTDYVSTSNTAASALQAEVDPNSVHTNHTGNVSITGNMRLGYGGSASGSYSLALGHGANAYGYASFAQGKTVKTYGTMSVAMGENAKATNDNTFVWSDGSTTFVDTTQQTFNVYAANGIYLFGGPVYGNAGGMTGCPSGADAAGSAIAVSNAAVLKATGASGTNTTGTVFVNGQATSIGTNTPWTAVGYVTNGGATVNGSAISNGAVLRTYSAVPVVLTPAVSTQWISYADGGWQYLAPTGNIVLAFSNNWPTTETSFMNLALYSGAYSVSVDAGSVSTSMWASVTLSTTKTNSIIWHRGYGWAKFAPVASTNWINP